jgi:hypothetical protein
VAVQKFGGTDKLVAEKLELSKERVRQVRSGLELEVGDVTIRLLGNICM